MRLRAAAAGAALALIGAHGVLADGIGTPQYRYLDPPKYLRATNISPLGGSATHSLSERGQSLFVYTNDSQVGLTFAHGAFGNPPGQRAIEIRIRPLRHFTPLPRQPFVLDGNVYGVSYKYLPSGRIPARSVKNVLISMEAPHTPNQLIGLVGRSWKPLCRLTGSHALFITPSSADCYARDLSPEITLVYKPFGSHAVRPVVRHSGLPVGLIAGIVLAMAAVAALLLVTLTKARRPQKATEAD